MNRSLVYNRVTFKPKALSDRLIVFGYVLDLQNSSTTNSTGVSIDHNYQTVETKISSSAAATVTPTTAVTDFDRAYLIYDILSLFETTDVQDSSCFEKLKQQCKDCLRQLLISAPNFVIQHLSEHILIHGGPSRPCIIITGLPIDQNFDASVDSYLGNRYDESYQLIVSHLTDITIGRKMPCSGS